MTNTTALQLQATTALFKQITDIAAPKPRRDNTIDSDYTEREMAALLPHLNDAMTIVREMRPHVTNEALQGSLRDMENGLSDMISDARYWHNLAEERNAEWAKP